MAYPTGLSKPNSPVYTWHRRLKRAWRDIRGHQWVIVLWYLGLITFVGGMWVFLLERTSPVGNIHSLQDALWWAIVTLTTVGYGDRYTVTLGGRMVGVVMALSGIGMVSLLTATVASNFVERRLQASKGLAETHWSGHVVICGWNLHGERVIEALYHGGQRKVVLAGTLPEDTFQTLYHRLNDVDIQLVAGDYTQESVLQRANVTAAHTVVLLADTVNQTGSLQGVDERTVIAAYAIRHLAPHVRICAELLTSQAERHLKRVPVSEIVVSEEYGGYLLANAVLASGITDFLRELLSAKGQYRLTRVELGQPWRGRSVGELATYMQTEGKLLLALHVQHSSLSLNEFLTGDDSAIETFIRRKFAESGRDLTLAEKAVVINPAADFVLEAHHAAIVLALGGEGDAGRES